MKKLTLITFAVTFSAFAALLALLPTPPDATASIANPQHPSVVIENVQIFDGTSMHPPTTLVLADGKISGFGDDIAHPDGARILDGTGKTALPGLIDAHTHSYGQARRDALRFGVTTVLDMFTAPALIKGIAASRESFAPTDTAALFSAGMLATVKSGHGTQFGVEIDVLSAPEQASQWVAARKAEGSDFIKLAYIPDARRLPSLDIATARAVIDAAHAQGMLAVAHISTQAAAMELLQAGIDGFVHAFADEPVSPQFIEQALKRGVFVIPTLSIIAAVDGHGFSTQLLQDERLAAFLNGQQRSSLSASFGSPRAGFSLLLAQANIGKLHAAGVPILAGSDAPNPGTAHGASLHQELQLLVASGMTAEQALACATSVPAHAFATEGRGIIAAGARADIVLVDADPAADITATRNITTIFRNGHEVLRTPGATVQAGNALPELLGDFEQGIDAPPGFTWAQTSDSMMGGSSTARLDFVKNGANGSAGAMVVEATVQADFAYPWAGVYLGLIPEGRTGDLSNYSAIEFDVRGTPDSYRLMLFSSDSLGLPPTATFAVTDTWSKISLPIANFAGLEARQLIGLAITTPMTPGTFKFELDNVRLVN